MGFDLEYPQELPGNFVLKGAAPVRHGSVLTASLEYSDGVRSLILFVTPATRMGPIGRGDPAPALGSGAREFGVGTLRVVTWETGGRRLALAGPLPLGNLIEIANAISQVGRR